MNVRVNLAVITVSTRQKASTAGVGNTSTCLLMEGLVYQVVMVVFIVCFYLYTNIHIRFKHAVDGMPIWNVLDSNLIVFVSGIEEVVLVLHSVNL